MLHLDVPGWGTFELEHLVLDLNGTVALDGEVIPGVVERLAALSVRLAVYLVTADTHGRGAAIAEKLGVRLARVEAGDEAAQKQALMKRLGVERVVALGNGVNDAGMLSVAALGIATLGAEGLAIEALQAAKVVVGGIKDALDLLLYPRRLAATLRR